MMGNTKTGGAAFPDPGRAQSAKQRERLTETGMTLRDYFAAEALQGLYAGGKANEHTSDAMLAKLSYAMADAMLAAREA
jgi:hypothetical protein